jgi:hypothetical protein
VHVAEECFHLLKVLLADRFRFANINGAGPHLEDSFGDIFRKPAAKSPGHVVACAATSQLKAFSVAIVLRRTHPKISADSKRPTASNQNLHSRNADMRTSLIFRTLSPSREAESFPGQSHERCPDALGAEPSADTHQRDERSNASIIGSVPARCAGCIVKVKPSASAPVDARAHPPDSLCRRS